MNHPEIHVTPPSPSASTLSFETASSNIQEWDLTPYHFNCPQLPSADDSTKELCEIATIRLPESHRLVDHTLGVAWKSFCNGRRDIGKLSPDQIAWAIKVLEANRNEHSQHSDDMKLLIEYWQEIVLAMYANGGNISMPLERTVDQSMVPLEDSSFVLTNMLPKGTPASISMDLPSSTLSPLSASTPLPVRADRLGSMSRTQNLLMQNLESLHQMLIRWKKNQMQRIDFDMKQLELIECILVSMAAKDRARTSTERTNVDDQVET